MRDLDGTDLEIIRMLLADGRRPFSDIADRVDLSPPAVSDRVDRLKELGIIQNFTVNVDRDSLSQAVPMYVRLRPQPTQVDSVFEKISTLDETEHVFKLADGSIVIHAHLPTHDTHSWLESTVNLSHIENMDAQPLTGFEWNVGLRPDGFDLSCVVCGNEVGRDGEFGRFDGEVKAFCCESCLSRYEQQYDAHREATEH